MGIDTKGYLKGDYTAAEVAHMLGRLGVEVTSVRQGAREDYSGDRPFWTKLSHVMFRQPDSSDGRLRNLCVFQASSQEPHKLEITGGAQVTELMLGHDEAAEKVIRGLVEQTGGWFCATDADPEWIAVARTRGVGGAELVAARADAISGELIKRAAAVAPDLGLSGDFLEELAKDLHHVVLERVREQAAAEPETAPRR